MELKIAVIGAGGVGKSALTGRYCLGQFYERYDPTIEDSYRKTVEVAGEIYTAEILDTAGSEAFASMRDLYYKDGEGFLLVFSVASPSSLEEVREMHAAIRRVKDGEVFSVVLVGNKCDMPRQVRREEGQELARAMGCTYLESSAMTGHNVEEGFSALFSEILAKRAAAATCDKKTTSGCIIL